MKTLITTTLLLIATMLQAQQDTVQLDTSISSEVEAIIKVLNENAKAAQEYNAKVRELNLIIASVKGAEERKFAGFTTGFKAVIFEKPKEKK